MQRLLLTLSRSTESEESKVQAASLHSQRLSSVHLLPPTRRQSLSQELSKYISGVSHGTLPLKNLLATSRHRSNKFLRAGIRVACLHNLLSPLLKGFSASFHETYSRFCLRPNILLWIQVWRILRPVRLHRDVPLPIRSLGNRGVQDRLRI